MKAPFVVELHRLERENAAAAAAAPWLCAGEYRFGFSM